MRRVYNQLGDSGCTRASVLEKEPQFWFWGACIYIAVPSLPWVGCLTSSLQEQAPAGSGGHSGLRFPSRHTLSFLRPESGKGVNQKWLVPLHFGALLLVPKSGIRKARETVGPVKSVLGVGGGT